MRNNPERPRNGRSVVPDENEPAKTMPTTARGLRTRAALVAAARAVFERDGYLDSRLTDITAEANCSTGSFYTYFDSKEEIFAAVVDEASEDLLHPGMQRVEGTSDPYFVIEASNRAYFKAYRRNAKLMGLLEQVASIDNKFREVRRQRGHDFARRNARSIAELQEQGLADPQLDPMKASRALSAMVGRLAYYTYVLNEHSELEELTFTATRLWCNALKISIPS